MSTIATLRHMYPSRIDEYLMQARLIVTDDGIQRWPSALGPQPTEAEIESAAPAALAAEQAEEAKRIESHTARDDAKRALAALDTIIAGAPTATTAQMRTAIEQLARIQKHAILATLGR